MTDGGYNQFCPVFHGSGDHLFPLDASRSVLGSTRFNELRRGLPSMSPALLSKRLKDLEAAGIVLRIAAERDPGARGN